MSNNNIRWNLLQHGTPLLAALLCVPFLIHGLGAERFGLLALAWAVIGYSGMLDLGLGRAITWRLAQSIDPGSAERAAVLGAAITFALVVGCIGALVLVRCSGVIIGPIYPVSPQLSTEAHTSIVIFALIIPLIVASSVLKGALESEGRFALIALIRVPTSVLIYATAAYSTSFYPSLAIVATIMLLARTVEMAALAVLCRNLLALRCRDLRLRWRPLGRLLSFGGWFTVSNVVGAIMMYADRFVIGAVISIAAVASYAPAYDVVTKLTIVATAITGAVFPAMSKTLVSDPVRSARLMEHTLIHIGRVAFPLCLAAVLFAYAFLHLWIGPAIARAAGSVFQIVAAGVFVNSIALVPLMLLHAAGRADVSGKLHLLETAPYLLLMYWAVREFGINGAAMAWTLRAAVDAVLLVILARRTGTSTRRFSRLSFTFLAYAPCLLALALLQPGSMYQIVAAVLLTATYGLFLWGQIRRATRDLILNTATG